MANSASNYSIRGCLRSVSSTSTLNKWALKNWPSIKVYIKGMGVLMSLTTSGSSSGSDCS